MTRTPSRKRTAKKRTAASSKKTSKKRATASRKRAASARAGAITFAAQSAGQAGMPASSSIVGVIGFTPFQGLGPLATGAAAAGRAPAARYQMILTNEVDAYERKPKQGEVVETFTALAAGDNFTGSDRRAAKLSIADAQFESFDDLRDLLATLPSVAAMKNRQPPIKSGPTSNRVSEEKRNVRVRAFLYAHSRENDNDYHLIIGRDPAKSPELYMTVEVSGLPSGNAASFPKLKTARNAYKKFFGSALPGTRYVFPRPPVPVLIEGSLFFDKIHATGQRPGPESLRSRMPTVWEVHPVSKIKLEP